MKDVGLLCVSASGQGVTMRGGSKRPKKYFKREDYKLATLTLFPFLVHSTYIRTESSSGSVFSFSPDPLPRGVVLLEVPGQVVAEDGDGGVRVVLDALQRGSRVRDEVGRRHL